MHTDITLGMLVTPLFKKVENLSENFPQDSIEFEGPFKVTGLFEDPDRPRHAIINLEGYRGAFPAEAFRVSTAEECRCH